MAIRKDLGAATAYALAVEGGYSGTQEQYEVLLASYGTVAQQARQYKEDTEAFAVGTRNGTEVGSTDPAYHNNAAYYATEITDAASTATQAKQDALDAKTDAVTAKNDAVQAKTDAVSAKNDAVQAKNDAVQAKTDAVDAKNDAVSAKTDAQTAKTAAETAQGKAETAQGKAEDAQAAAELAAASLVIDSALSSSSTNPVQNKVIAGELGDLKSQISQKANIDGSYANMTVGNAEQLVSTIGITDTAPYLFRTSGGSADIGDRKNIKKIVGGNIAWNQMTYDGNFTSADNWEKQNGNPTLVVANNEITVTFTGGVDTPSVYNPAFRMKNTIYNYIKDHIYLFSFDFKPTKDGAPSYRTDAFGGSIAITNTATANAWTHYDVMRKSFASYAQPGYWGQANASTVVGVGDSISYRKICVFDLTQMFGSTIADYIYSLEQATAGAGVAWFKHYFPRDYYPYCAGSLPGVNVSANRMTGFNQFEGAVEIGKLWGSDGTYKDGTSNNASTSQKLRCIPNTTYCICVPNNNGSLAFYPVEFDADKNYLRTHDYKMITQGGYTYRTFATSADAHYMSFYFYKSGLAADEVRNICINFHWDGERDGEYEPYTQHTYPLDSTITLNGIPKLNANNELEYDGDTYEPDGTVTRRYGVVDLGTLTWLVVGSTHLFYAELNSMATDSGNIGVCPRYSYTGETTSSPDKSISFNQAYYGSHKIGIHDESFDTATALKSALSGVYLVYELATPTTETADPYAPTMIVDDWGTEEFVVTESADGVAVPVGHETMYQNNLRAKLEMAPNSPADGDGDYIVRQTNGQNAYVPISFPADELPAAPTTDGAYHLKCTVSSGTATYTWEADT